MSATAAFGPIVAIEGVEKAAAVLALKLARVLGVTAEAQFRLED